MRSRRSASCCSPASAGSPRSARPRSSASAPTRRPGTRRCKAARRGSDCCWRSLLTGLVATILGAATLAAQRPFPAAQHHRLGHRHLFRVRQSRRAQPLQRAVRHSADLDRTALARRHHRDLLLHLDSARRRHAALPQPARFAAGPRHPQPARRHCHGGKPRDRLLPHAAGDLRSRRRCSPVFPAGSMPTCSAS